MIDKVPLVYLDVCALNRPFDDQSQMRVKFETAAVHLILANVRSSLLQLAASPVHNAELSAIPDPARRISLQALIRELGLHIAVDTKSVRERAHDLHLQGMGVADAAHIAYSEAVGADFVTVDDRLLRQCIRLGVQVWTGTPNGFCEKEGLR